MMAKKSIKVINNDATTKTSEKPVFNKVHVAWATNPVP